MLPFHMSLAALMRCVAALRTALIDGGSFKLFTNDYTPSVNTVVADLVEATFTGYAPVVATLWSGVYSTGDSQGASNSPLASFAPASPYTVGDIVVGWWYEDKNGDYFCGGRFDSPVNMNGAGQLLEILARFIQGDQPA